MCDATPRYLRFLVWYDIETSSNETPWQEMTKHAAVNVVIYVVYILKTKDHFCWCQKMKLVWLLDFVNQEGFHVKISGAQHNTEATHKGYF